MAESRTVEFRCDVPVRHTVDVFVAGGGPAGLAAAVTAARQGRHVFLAEGHTCFGGMGTAGLVPAMMSVGDGVHFLAGGFGKEVIDRLFAAKGAGPQDRPDSHACICVKVEVLKRIYDDMVLESGADFAFQTHLVAVETRDGHVEHVICAAKSGLFAVKAKIYVDGTGDGDLAAWAGAPFEKGDAQGRLMPGTLCSLWANVDWPVVWKSGLWPEAELPRAFPDKIFTREDRHLPGMWPVDENIGGGNIGHAFDVDGTDERSVTQALLWSRKVILEYERFFKQYLKGYERMVLVGTGSLPGIRESRRIMGDYVLGLEDFKNRAVFADEIGRFSYPVDIHPLAADEAAYAEYRDKWQNLRYKNGENYGIPYRTLVPRNVDNVLVAGRCVSTDRYVQGSIRVMPGCFITGQAAGMAAAIAVEEDVDTRGISVPELQRRLKKMGMFLPNFKG